MTWACSRYGLAQKVAANLPFRADDGASRNYRLGTNANAFSADAQVRQGAISSSPIRGNALLLSASHFDLLETYFGSPIAIT
jgi:hypothetical protein